ncbi:MAG: GNAT family N-acetyltransferase [Actinomycetes bacterium]
MTGAPPPADDELVLRVPRPRPGDGTVTLRPWEDDDVPTVLDASHDPRVVSMTTIPAGVDAAGARAWVARQHERLHDGRGIALAVADAADTALGFVGLGDLDPWARRADVGVWVAPAHRRRGVARRAVALLADWALGEAGLVRLVAHVAPDNPASRRVFEEAGFRVEGHALAAVRLDDGWVDVDVLARVADDVPRTTWSGHPPAGR